MLINDKSSCIPDENPSGRHPGTIALKVAVHPTAPQATRRTQDVCRQFGLLAHPEPVILLADTKLSLEPGQITLVTGPSGSGKSMTLRHLADQLGRRAIRVDRQRLTPARPIIDQVAPGRPLPRAITLLTRCGLGEPQLWLRTPNALSAGQRFRAQMARSIALAQDTPNRILLVDEFCAILHRRLACAMACNLRKLVTVASLCLIVATTHEDILPDLHPDHILRLAETAPDSSGATPESFAGVLARTGRAGCHGHVVCDHGTLRSGMTPSAPGDLDHPGEAVVDEGGSASAAGVRPCPISFLPRLRIARGSLSDYTLFDSMHYRRRTALGPIDKVFVLRDGDAGQILGVVVYGYSPLSLRLRHVALARVYPRDARLLNRDFRILRRLVIHPDVRGCGLAHHLVRQTLPLVGTRYVECLAAMGTVSPVFQRAGMIRIGTAGPSPAQQRLHNALAALDVDPLSPSFADLVVRRKDVRDLVTRRVHRWLCATTNRRPERIGRLTPQALVAAFIQLTGTTPAYYLWSSDEIENARLRNLAGP